MRLDFERIAEAIEVGTAEIKKAARALNRADVKLDDATKELRVLRKEKAIALREFEQSLRPKVKQAPPRVKPEPEPEPEPVEPEPIEEPINEPT